MRRGGRVTRGRVTKRGEWGPPFRGQGSGDKGQGTRGGGARPEGGTVHGYILFKWDSDALGRAGAGGDGVVMAGVDLTKTRDLRAYFDSGDNGPSRPDRVFPDTLA